MKKTNLIAVLILTLSVYPACCAELLVPGEYPTIRKAINAVHAGDRIIVAPNTYIKDIYITKIDIILTSTDPNNTSVVTITIIR